MQALQNKSGSGVVTIPKADLERDGLLDEDGQPAEDQMMMVERLGERCYLVRAVDGDIPEVEECPAVRRLAAEMMLQEDALGTPSAD